MKIQPFGVEQWMNEWEEHCRYNIAETCVDSLTIGELLEISGEPEKVIREMAQLKMTYGHILGSPRLRSLVAALYSSQKADNVLITHGAVGANSLVYKTLVEPGDTTISVLPTYQQHYSIPRSFGAQVKVLRLREESKFLPDINELRSLVDSKTKLIAINNPNNPTGALMGPEMLKQIVEVARDVDAWLLCDEVYRGTDQEGGGATCSIADMYEKGVSTGSMSKTFSLAGLRLGWIVGSKKLLERIEIQRDYDTISVGVLDDYFATKALENVDKILERSKDILRRNLNVLDKWVRNEPLITYVKPTSGTTALLKYNLPIGSRDFCIRLLQSYGVMLTPGAAMEVEGSLRVGFTNNEKTLGRGLELTSRFLSEMSKELSGNACGLSPRQMPAH